VVGARPWQHRGVGEPERELERELERVTDRLRLVGPRLGRRGTEEAAERLADVRAVLQQLADLGAVAEGGPRRPVPVLGEHALADQLLVLGHGLCGDGCAPGSAPLRCPKPAGASESRSESRAELVRAATELVQGLRARL